MPIDINRFENADELRNPPTSKQVIQFLVSHEDHAYTRREIAEAIDANPETVGTSLTRLKERELVRHREPYWAITNDWGHVLSTIRERYDDSAFALRLDIDKEHDGTTQTGSGEVNETDNANSAHARGSESATTPSSKQSSSNPKRTSHYRAAASDFFERVQRQFDDAIDGLYLFGSTAQENSAADSDVDILAVISEEADYATVDDQLLDIAYDVQLEYGVRIELHSLTASEFASRKDRGDPFIRSVIESGESIV